MCGGYTVSQRLKASCSSYSLQGIRASKEQGSLSAAAGEPQDRRRPPSCAVTSTGRWQQVDRLSREWPGILGWEVLVFYFAVFYPPLYSILFCIKNKKSASCIYKPHSLPRAQLFSLPARSCHRPAVVDEKTESGRGKDFC